MGGVRREQQETGENRLDLYNRLRPLCECVCENETFKLIKMYFEMVSPLQKI